MLHLTGYLWVRPKCQLGTKTLDSIDIMENPFTRFQNKVTHVWDRTHSARSIKVKITNIFDYWIEERLPKQFANGQNKSPIEGGQKYWISLIALSNYKLKYLWGGREKHGVGNVQEMMMMLIQDVGVRTVLQFIPSKYTHRRVNKQDNSVTPLLVLSSTALLTKWSL